ncbi:MAG: tetratricopeptide repeat-containing serine protease family protein [Nostoc sp. DedSLP03]|uniref:tetratricopeptide repeat-containing serine protease family protein n=1 Tax=Nostoc sp. DedSLP03 TaxID=3075400 RepID=UPI002AD2E675|nr:tetratricopeptide repeat-containing serine protease family protein [Nostoc sp. DedSLP03]MDZ7965449.1 tetratricopeptide repeat-containing serine protease family protein [Nostoc sp. DedSLP03]
MIPWYWYATFGFIALSLISCNSRKTPGEIAKEAQESVVLINYADKPGQGTGFFVPGKNKEVCTVLTARHVVPPSAKLKLQTNDQKIWTVTDITRFPQQDLAVVTFKPDGGTCLYKALPLGDSDKVSLGDSIYITGFPGNSLKRQFIVGTVSSIDSLTDGYGISYSATTAGGMSGGPAMNAIGEVIAVHGLTELELIRQAELKGETPPPQQQSTTIANSQPGDGTFKWGIPINTYLTEVVKQAEITQKSEDFWNEGNDYFVKQKYKEAIASYDKAIAIKPDYHEAWYNRGNSLANLQRYSEAIASYDKAVAIKPDDQDAWHSRGISLDNLKRYSEAIASYDKAVAIKPDDQDAWHSRGISLDNLKRYSEAIASYDKAIAIKPDYHLAWHNRGVSLERLQRYSEALASYDKATVIKPDDQDAWYGRGFSLGKLERDSEAIASYDKAVAIKPDFHEAWNNRGVSLKNLQRYSEAIASYDKAVAIKPDFHEAWNNRGVSLKNLQRYSEAIASYDKALAIKPDYQLAINNRNILLKQLGRSN